MTRNMFVLLFDVLNTTNPFRLRLMSNIAILHQNILPQNIFRHFQERQQVIDNAEAKE